MSIQIHATDEQDDNVKPGVTRNEPTNDGNRGQSSRQVKTAKHDHRGFMEKMKLKKAKAISDMKKMFPTEPYKVGDNVYAQYPDALGSDGKLPPFGMATVMEAPPQNTDEGNHGSSKSNLGHQVHQYKVQWTEVGHADSVVPHDHLTR